MKELKKTFFYTFFCVEMIFFLFFYAFGTHGIQALQCLVQENDVLRSANSQTKAEIKELEHACESWEHSSFYKEKIARERLQMARQGDVIYYLD